MTPQELKNSILQLAIQGKLVEQRPEEGTAAELLRDILTQRSRDAECAKVGRDHRARRNASATAPRPLIPDDEKPFDIPESWEWVRLGEVCEILDSKRRPITKSERTSGPYPYYGASCVQDYVADYIFDEPLVLLGEDGAKWGRGDNSAFRISGKAWVNNHAHVLRPLPEIDHAYLVHTLCILDLRIFVTGTTVPKLNQARMCQILLPLPPLAEQKRIVAKIEELLPLIDRYEKAWSKLEDFNKRFPVDMQKSLLQMAIQGKLVEQRPEEGTGEELYRRLKPYHKGLKPCKEELDYSSMDFDVPTNWTMIELNQLFDFVDYRGKTPNKTTSGVFLITASNIRQAYMDYTRKEYISREEYKGRQSRGLTQKGDLLFTTEAPMGNAALCDLDECSCGQRIITFKEYAKGTAYPALYMYFILSPQFQQQLLDNCTGTTAKGIKADKLKHFLIPLPPLAEQKRIVAKLEELLPLCERLK